MKTFRSNGEAAAYYAELGFYVFPCLPGTKVPLTEHGWKNATTDADQIDRWWTEYPLANVAIATWGLCVLDIDGHNNTWPGEDRLYDLSVCPVSQTPHGGSHHIFKQPAGAAWGNTASRLAAKVDTRCNGGYIVVPPSAVDGRAYQWVETRELDGPAESLPEPPAWIAAVLGQNGSLASRAAGPVAIGQNGGGNVIPSGQRNDALARLAGNMRRSGMTQDEILAALLQVNIGRCKPPLSESEVKKVAASIARYEPDQLAVAFVENFWAQDIDLTQESVDGLVQDPGGLPDEVLRVPGFVSEVMDYTLETAPYPNQAMAFCGALALQATLCGRKVRDSGDNRTNLYLLGLAYSSAGKDRPRKVNAEILHAIGLGDMLGGLFASGEGIQDALFTEPCMLFQTDEIDSILQSINKAKDARYESIMATLLVMYSSANSVFPMRRKAGKESPGAIDQPCLTILGTAIPNHYYEALSERMLTNGFFARMVTVDCGKRSSGQEPRILPIPQRLLETASDWSAFRPVPDGNLSALHPVPAIVPHSEEAAGMLADIRAEADLEYRKSEDGGDPIGTTVWGRVGEHIRKLALVYAVSENAAAPVIGHAALAWARGFVMHQTRRTLFQASSHVASTPFDAECLRCLKKVREAPGHEMAHQTLLKRMKMDARSFLALVTTLEQRGDLVVEMRQNGSRAGRFYATPNGRKA